jgi:hypothetical protein
MSEAARAKNLEMIKQNSLPGAAVDVMKLIKDQEAKEARSRRRMIRKVMNDRYSEAGLFSLIEYGDPNEDSL